MSGVPGTSGPAIAVVGVGCRYPDATSPAQLWENVLTGRRAFRPLPPGRLNLADYAGDGPDSTNVRSAAVLTDWTFDRARHRVSGASHRVTDPVHWLALQVAAETLEDAGFPDARGLSRDRVGVVLGNSLTGEFSRAGLLRLRWPYVARVVRDALADGGLGDAEAAALMARLERGFKAPFPEPTGESLVGGLANAVAGRVCNHFDLRGGGYTVDGACASSLLAVTTACAALASGDLDLVLAGGVDASLDPFELVGFARLGALGGDEMRIYDARPTGFLPGEGCGMVALMRAGDAAEAGRVPLAVIRGWGVSSDGSGGLTRPARDGHVLAMRRAYGRAGFGPDTVALFEGHGTGTDVGDRTELEALIAVQDGRRLPPAALGSVKANIGHTKAAAGAAGLLKAVLALHHQTVPPTVGCETEHDLLRTPDAPLRTVREAAPWPDAPLRAGVSAMGFGGINTHVVLEAAEARRPTCPRSLPRGALDAEVFVVGAASSEALAGKLERLAERADVCALAEHLDMAAALADVACDGDEANAAVRAAVVARTPAEFAERARQVAARLAEGVAFGLVSGPGHWLGSGPPGRVGLLFPGQSAPVRGSHGALGALLPGLEPVPAPAVDAPDGRDTAVAQPAVLRSSLAGLRLLDALGVVASGASGHSLGEITALCWAGALTARQAVDLAAERGRIMAATGDRDTGMAALAAPAGTVAELVAGTGVAVAADNGPVQVVAGRLAELEAVVERARLAGVGARVLRVSHAFHTPAVAAAVPGVRRVLERTEFDRPRRTVLSTVTGRTLEPADDLRELLVRQVTAPVRFAAALEALAAACDLLVECGPGHSLTALAEQITGVPVVALDAGSVSGEPVARTVAALFAAGAAHDVRPLFAERVHRPFDLDRPPAFLTNPCESAPAVPVPRTEAGGDRPVEPPAAPAPDGGDPLAVVRALVAEALELPAGMIGDGDGLLADLHLNSLRVTQLAAEAAVRCGRTAPSAPPRLASATVAALAETIAALPASDGARDTVEGVDRWFRVFALERRPARPAGDGGARAWRLSGHGPLRKAVAPLLQDDPDAPPALAVFLSEDPADQVVADLLEAAAEAVRGDVPLTVVDHGDTASGFLGGLALEHPGLALRRIAVEDAPASAVAGALSGTWDGFAELLVDASGARFTPAHRPLALPPDGPPLAPGDVLLVTGGGRGIGLETASHLAGRWRVRLALLGRSDPGDDPGLAANLARLDAEGATFDYAPADLRDARSARAALDRLTARLGPVRGVVHGTAVNRPARFTDLTERDFADHDAPKRLGLRALLDVLDPAGLRLLVTYGSVIGRFGLPGEAHYALANGRQRELARVLARELPGCRVRNIDWTAWSGAGMGERLAVLSTLTRTGVDPIPVEEGVRLLARVAESSAGPASVVASGRLPALEARAERALTHTPGVETVTETRLSVADLPWLPDHRIDGLLVLPAVAALELMTRAARELTGAPLAGVTGGAFTRPLIIPDKGERVVRVCALTGEGGGGVRVALRSDETGFALDHFTGTVTAASAPPAVPASEGAVPAHDGRALYGPLFFHGPAFQRLRRFERLEARGCRAVLDPGTASSDGVLGDLFRNDASIHVLQACVPHRRLLPVGCDRFAVHAPQAAAKAGGPLTLTARERSHHGADHTYDVQLTDASGAPVLSWAGLRLRDVGPLLDGQDLPSVLVGPYVQRHLDDLLPRAAARPGEDGLAVAEGAALAVAPDDDPDPWPGEAERLARLVGEPPARSLERLRTVAACLRAAGGDPSERPVAGGVYENGWVTLSTGTHEIASAVVTVTGRDTPLVLAAAARKGTGP
ncbi:type I polyketide synthase [Actinomadura oligospora]|uniref:type I polyketide synthase n=1 Tax=Actinomadura oligospora TaxID=111804 RepID=UPI000687EA3B|nr:type I polyketide synthase [Actinomadura oligospora]